MYKSAISNNSDKLLVHLVVCTAISYPIIHHALVILAINLTLKWSLEWDNASVDVGYVLCEYISFGKMATTLKAAGYIS